MINVVIDEEVSGSRRSTRSSGATTSDAGHSGETSDLGVSRPALAASGSRIEIQGKPRPENPEG